MTLRAWPLNTARLILLMVTPNGLPLTIEFYCTALFSLICFSFTPFQGTRSFGGTSVTGLITSTIKLMVMAVTALLLVAVLQDSVPEDYFDTSREVAASGGDFHSVEDMEKRMELLETVLENSQGAEGNMEAVQSETEMQGLMNNELERQSRMLANLGLVQSARERLKLDEDRRAMAAEERVMTLRLRDRNNMV